GGGAVGATPVRRLSAPRTPRAGILRVRRRSIGWYPARDIGVWQPKQPGAVPRASLAAGGSACARRPRTRDQRPTLAFVGLWPFVLGLSRCDHSLVLARGMDGRGRGVNGADAAGGAAAGRASA